MNTIHSFFGYNSLRYDCQVIQYIIDNPTCTTQEIKNFSNALIASEWPIYRDTDIAMKTIDLMLVNNYGHLSARSTSLKKLEFNLRKKILKIYRIITKILSIHLKKSMKLLNIVIMMLKLPKMF